MQDWQQTIYSQYGASPVILGLIEAFNAAVDPADRNDDFYDLVWNVLTAEGYGLDVWGRIVGVTRYLEVEAGIYLGFGEVDDPDHEDGFGTGIFWNGTPASSTYPLTDEAFRVLVLAKALSNISRASISSYNALLNLLFPGRGIAFVTDTGSMTARLTFEFTLEPFEVAIVKQSGVLAPPTGVGFDVMVVPDFLVFGFGETGDYEGFDTGFFFGGFE